MKTKGEIYKVRYNDHCLEFASAMMNAKYPERADNSTSTAPNYKPIHDWTSHFRTAFEYLINYLLENTTAEK